jgi:HD-GYP domain-containing protein (c-di-GMP phosphodiesterase class II)
MSAASHLTLVRPTEADAALPAVLESIRQRGERIGLRLERCPVGELAPGVTLAPLRHDAFELSVRIGEAALRTLIGGPDADLGDRPTFRSENPACDAERFAEVLRWSVEDLTQGDANERIVADFCDKLAQAYEETYALFRALRMLASSEEPDAMVHSLCADIQRTLPFRWIAVQFGRNERIAPTLRARLIMAGAFPGDVPSLERLTADRVSQLRGDSWTKVLEPARDPIAALASSEVICEPVTHDNSVIGLLLAGGKTGTDTQIASPEIQFLDATADFLGTFHENIARFDEQRAMMNSTLEALVAAIDAKDRYTCGHSERVALVAGAIARAMGMDEPTIERIRLSGLVHDVGKIGVPEAILCKPGKPTDEEFAAIKRHPEIGHHILHGIAGFEDLLPGVLHHHERWDGRGYPHRLAAEQIPLIARIIGLADAFDAMSSTRSYRAALPRERVLEEIRRGAGSQFDPRVALAFEGVDLTAYDELLAQHCGAEEWSKRAAA